jgi:glycosyltransferase involved in cell wall biosynthesis
MPRPLEPITLRVAINATPLLSPLTGIGNYIVQLGAALHARGDIDVHSFYGYRWRHEPPCPPVPGVRSIAATRVRDLIRPWIPMKRELRNLQQQVTFTRGLHRRAIELYHEPNYVPVRYDVPVVVTIHDLSWLRYPETHPADRVRWLERGLPRALERAAAILVDSAFVRDEVVAMFDVSPQRVTVAHLGVSPAFRPRRPEETAVTLRPLGLQHGQYLLSVGTIEPRKNVGHVLAAFARLPAALRKTFPLVIAGARGWRAADLERELGLLADRGQVRFLGHVPADDLPHLYAGATAFVFPSLYEGFGLPPLEAMACGVPVLASDRAAMPEVIGDAGVAIDPERPEDTAIKIAALLEDAGTRADLAHRGEIRAHGFTWQACAQATVQAYHRALGRSATSA